MPSQCRLNMQITIIIPTYNEAENLPKLIPQVLGLPLPDIKLLMVDDDSPDGTGPLVEKMKAGFSGRLDILHRAGKQGLGTAYLQGFHQAIKAGAEAVGQMDADFSHPPEKILAMAAAIENCDAVIGSRYVQGGSVDENWPLWRKGLSAFGNFYARTILNINVRDTTGGFRLWRNTTLLGMPLERLKSNGYAFQVELTYVAHLMGYQFAEIPIYFADRRWGDSKMSFKIQREAAFRVWQMLFNYRDLRKK